MPLLLWPRLAALAVPLCCSAFRLPDRPYGPDTTYDVFDIDCATDAMFTGGCSCTSDLAGARIMIDDCKPGDQLEPPPSAAAFGATTNWEVAPSCTLAMAGALTVGQYLTLISETKFRTSETDEADKMVRYTLGESTYSPTTGHFYKNFEIAKAVPDQSWYNAQCFCGDPSNDVLGLVGYLLTITSQEEKDWASKYIHGQGWLGASDLGAEGNWRWIVGPEGCPGYDTDPTANPCTRSACDVGVQTGSGGCNGGSQCDMGELFYVGQAPAGSVQPGEYASWANGEPNDNGPEHFLHNLDDFNWNDYPLRMPGSIVSFECEWGEVGDICIDDKSWKQEQLFTFGLDECLSNGQVCSQVQQTCDDPNPHPSRTGDWECTCAPPLLGSLQAGPATCACPAGHIGNPPAVPCEPCMVNDHCNGNAASSAPNAMATECTCACLPGFTGATCDTCDPGLSGPQCDSCAMGFVGTAPACRECTNMNDCNGNAMSVTDNNRQTCECTCLPGFMGLDCSGCDTGLSGANCDSCAVGYVGTAPTCRECTIADDCNDNAMSVTDDSRQTCVCTCLPGFTGASCDQCQTGLSGPQCDSCATGYVGTAPTACRECAINNDCNGNAISVTDNNRQTCECTCLPGFTGPSCSNCGPGVTGPNCDACAAGYVGTAPTCRLCTVADDCNGQAMSVTDDGFRLTCECACRNGFAGTSCDRCDDGFTGLTCDRCAAGYVSYPSCQQCSVTMHCSGNAESVTTDTDQRRCECSCKNGFEGAACNVCAGGYAGKNCDQCAANYVGFPQCEKCSIATHCNGNAGAVQGDGTGRACVCSCSWGFTGPSCQDCDVGFAGVGCSTCAAGFVDYPRCEECSNMQHCSGKATVVSDDGLRGSCKCTCADGFSGDRCEECAVGYVNYPVCAQCSVDDHCNGNAVSAIDDGTGGMCTCTCKAGFDGPTCDRCAPGFIGYPTCAQCNARTHCNGNAVSVTDDGTRRTCVCDCAAGFADANTGCDKCAAGYYDYPSCYVVDCSNAVTCNGNAVSATVVGRSCECTCKPGFAGASCERCAAGSTGYPSCAACSIAADCSGNAASVSANSLGTACECTCSEGFAGAKCDECAEGFVNYPNCDKCSATRSCNGHAWSVTDDGARASCVCDCKDGFEGNTCDRCAGGHTGYPDCQRCSLPVDCNSHAYSVTSDPINDVCVCDCKVGFDDLNCDRCAQGYITYPQCYECTNHFHCSANAISVSSDVGNNECICDCKRGYEGAMCNVCADGYDGYPHCSPIACTVTDPCNNNAAKAVLLKTSCKCHCTPGYEGENCDACAEGYIGYPSCRACDVAADCGANAVSVSDDGFRTECTCRCLPGFAGEACDECAVGHVHFPQCKQCSIAYHCNGNGVDVWDDGIRSGCVCECKQNFEGITCGHCHAGYVGYPECLQCSSETHCNGNAAVATEDGTRTACLCDCKEGYTGLKCDACAPGYVGYPNCVACSAEAYCQGKATSARLDASAPDGCSCDCKANYTGSSCGECASTYFGYPECGGCTVEEYCNSNADSISSNRAGTTCECTCSTGFAGDECDVCIDGYFGYPSCAQCNVSRHCSDNARSVASDANRTSCVCDCEIGFDGAGCDRCAEGYIDYPTCLQCTAEGYCNGNSVNVTDDGMGGACVCTCREGYAGESCGECAPGFIGYPACEACTIEEHCDGHALSVTDDGNGACKCICGDGYGGPGCSACAEGVGGASCDVCLVGYAGYPTCERCDADAHCNGNAVTAISSATGDSCECQCKAGFAGETCKVCAEGYIGAPTCLACTSATHCNGNAENVTDNGTRQRCDCTCKRNFAGYTCDTCAAGFINFPACEECSSDAHCNGNAVTARSNATGDGCTCECAAGYVGESCNACAAGYVGYPECVICGVDTACYGNALSAVQDVNADRCVCNCVDGFAGTRCEACAAGFDGYPDCKAAPTPPTPTPRGPGTWRLCFHESVLRCAGRECTVPDAIADEIRQSVLKSLQMNSTEADLVAVAEDSVCTVDTKLCRQGSCWLSVTVPGEQRDAMGACVEGLSEGTRGTCPKLKGVGIWDEAQPRRTVGGTGEDDDDDGGDFPWWILIVAAVLLLCCSLFLLAAQKKKRQEEEEKARQESLMPSIEALPYGEVELSEAPPAFEEPQSKPNVPLHAMPVPYPPATPSLYDAPRAAPMPAASQHSRSLPPVEQSPRQSVTIHGSPGAVYPGASPRTTVFASPGRDPSQRSSVFLSPQLGTTPVLIPRSQGRPY
eukprot:TRINITY_DN2536_c0_g1_i2.p1 TRINITY_DN2536_c0_g1~~TRINITY_DN2536_c0_g1_i2.p1  ORF type:complete len:2247 (+),score=148.96 TRINITY_DN2536_c0_g1_i2:33-6773(+)